MAGGAAYTAVSGIGRDGAPAASTRSIGLFTSLPILWRETGDIADLLRTDAPPHWAGTALAEQGRVTPLDMLETGLSRIDILVMAQPRALLPQENVALDTWVRGGGRVLLFADPMLTADSAFALGDRRRPQDIAMLSPILGRWGLRLEFDQGQPAGPRVAHVLGAAMPVDLAGRFAVTSTDSLCRIAGEGLLAECRIGKGRLVAIADAALLDAGTGEDRRDRARVLALALDRAGESE